MYRPTPQKFYTLEACLYVHKNPKLHKKLCVCVCKSLALAFARVFSSPCDFHFLKHLKSVIIFSLFTFFVILLCAHTMCRLPEQQVLCVSQTLILLRGRNHKYSGIYETFEAAWDRLCSFSLLNVTFFCFYKSRQKHFFNLLAFTGLLKPCFPGWNWHKSACVLIHNLHFVHCFELKSSWMCAETISSWLCFLFEKILKALVI